MYYSLAMSLFLYVSNYKCDMPEIMLDNLMSHLASNYSDLDFIMWTGYRCLALYTRSYALR
jgi:hypothetical protein